MVHRLYGIEDDGFSHVKQKDSSTSIPNSKPEKTNATKSRRKIEPIVAMNLHFPLWVADVRPDTCNQLELARPRAQTHTQSDLCRRNQGDCSYAQ